MRGGVHVHVLDGLQSRPTLQCGAIPDEELVGIGTGASRRPRRHRGRRPHEERRERGDRRSARSGRSARDRRGSRAEPSIVGRCRTCVACPHLDEVRTRGRRDENPGVRGAVLLSHAPRRSVVTSHGRRPCCDRARAEMTDCRRRGSARPRCIHWMQSCSRCSTSSRRCRRNVIRVCW